MKLASSIVLALSPFLALSVIGQYVSALAGAALWMAFLAYGEVRRRALGRPLNPLVVVLAVVVVGLTANGVLRGSTWLAAYGSVAAYAVLAATAVVSVVVGRPYTAGQARAFVPPALWHHPIFLRVNNVLSLLWGGAFVVNAVLCFVTPDFWSQLVSTYAVLAVAMVATDRYPARIQARFAQ